MSDWVLPTIDLERCTGCGFCVEYCPTGAVELQAGKPVITQPKACSYCGICEDLCPENVISLVFEILPLSSQNEKNKDDQ